MVRLIVGISILCGSFGIPSTGHAQPRQILEEHFNIDMNSPRGCRSENVELTSLPGSFCAITGVGGGFAGGGEFGRVVKIDNVWRFQGNSCQAAVFFAVTCFRVF
jgi:hypothetical protein